MMAITSATGCATMSEPEYPRLGATQTPLHSALKTTPKHAPHRTQPRITNPILNEAVTESPAAAEPTPQNLRDPLADLFYDHYKEWRGTRYRLGGLSKGGIDCSGFVYLTFLDRLGIELPRSTHFQVQRGQDVTRNNLQTGDLVFFRTGSYNHVGIYLENNRFMHSSTKSGVRISNMNNTYWKRTYWKAKRLSLPDQPQLAHLH